MRPPPGLGRGVRRGIAPQKPPRHRRDHHPHQRHDLRKQWGSVARSPQVRETWVGGGSEWISCRGGRLSFRVCSASNASLVHVRAMSVRAARIRGFGACAAILWQSAARSLHSSGVNNTPIPQRKRGAEHDPDGPPCGSAGRSKAPHRTPSPRMVEWQEFHERSVGYSTQWKENSTLQVT